MEALIVTNSDKTFSQVAEVVRASGDYDIVRASSGASAGRMADMRDFDLAIIGSIADMRGKELAQALAARSMTGVILIEDSFTGEAVAAQLEGEGVIVLTRPVGRAFLVMAIKLVGATNARVGNLRKENVDLAREIEDMKFINKAKYVLMESLGYTENQAHKYIERRAMDERRTRKAVAMEVLKTYGI